MGPPGPWRAFSALSRILVVTRTAAEHHPETLALLDKGFSVRSPWVCTADPNITPLLVWCSPSGSVRCQSVMLMRKARALRLKMTNMSMYSTGLDFLPPSANPRTATRLDRGQPGGSVVWTWELL